MPAGSGIVASTSFTPDSAGKLVLTITYDCRGYSGGDWGASYTSKPYMTQGGITTYGDEIPMSNTRGAQTLRAVFTGVTAGDSAEVGIYGSISGAVQATWWNVNITAELIKV